MKVSTKDSAKFTDRQASLLGKRMEGVLEDFRTHDIGKSVLKLYRSLIAVLENMQEFMDQNFDYYPDTVEGRLEIALMQFAEDQVASDKFDFLQKVIEIARSKFEMVSEEYEASWSDWQEEVDSDAPAPESTV